MKKLLAAAAVAAVCSAMASQAAAETYASLGAGQQSLDFASVGGGEATVTTVTGRLGWKSESWYGVEGEIYGGLGDDQISATPKVDVGISTSVALYGVAFVPAGDKLTFHARLGFNRLLGKVKTATTSTDTNDGEISYGAGASFKFNPTNSVRGDYTVTEITGVDASSWSISFVRSF